MTAEDADELDCALVFVERCEDCGHLMIVSNQDLQAVIVKRSAGGAGITVFEAIAMQTLDTLVAFCKANNLRFHFGPQISARPGVEVEADAEADAAVDEGPPVAAAGRRLH